MVEKKGLKICEPVAEGIKELVEESLKRHSEVPPNIVKIIREIARNDQETHEMFRGKGGPLDIY